MLIISGGFGAAGKLLLPWFALKVLFCVRLLFDPSAYTRQESVQSDVKTSPLDSSFTKRMFLSAKFAGDEEVDITNIYAGEHHTVALGKDGVLWSSGDNKHGYILSLKLK